MKIKATLLISAFLTASILTVVGGIATMTKNEKTELANASTQTSLVQSTRDAAYQNLINQANQTIDQANSEITNLQSQLQQQSSTPTAAAYAILPDQASAIASKASGQVVQATPKLVNYNGKAAYEVVFQSGNVYVDANTGLVLFNGALVAQTISAEQASQIAINYTGNSTVVGVATGLYNNTAAYQVTFQNGEVVYLDMTGTVLAVQVPSSVKSNSSSENQD
jgi:uncharacterized membrane protein YkoI